MLFTNDLMWNPIVLKNSSFWWKIDLTGTCQRNGNKGSYASEQQHEGLSSADVFDANNISDNGCLDRKITTYNEVQKQTDKFPLNDDVHRPSFDTWTQPLAYSTSYNNIKYNQTLSRSHYRL